jgi:hypothetical protein
MMFELFSEVALAMDVPSEGLRRGDVATIVDHFPPADGEEGYALEVFTALGTTIKVVVLPRSALKALSEEDIWSVRALS